MTQPSGLELVVERATLDRSFRERLLANPQAAIRDAFGVDLPDNFRLRFVERSPDDDLLIVLPDAVDEGLSADQLKDVAGGSSGCAWLMAGTRDTS